MAEQAQAKLAMVWRQFVAQFPVGLHQLDVMIAEDYEHFVRDKILVTVRAKVLAHQLAPAVVPFHEERLQRQTITVRRFIERPASRWQALRAAFGWSAEYLEASWAEELEVFVPIVCDHEITIDREHHFPEATIRYPEPLGRHFLWEDIRATD